MTATIKKVLVVEDSELLHNMYRIILKRYENCTLVNKLSRTPLSPMQTLLTAITNRIKASETE